MRNNQDRIGTTTPSDSVNSANIEAQQTNNLEFIVPTEIVELPSRVFSTMRDILCIM